MLKYKNIEQLIKEENIKQLTSSEQFKTIHDKLIYKLNVDGYKNINDTTLFLGIEKPSPDILKIIRHKGNAYILFDNESFPLIKVFITKLINQTNNKNGYQIKPEQVTFIIQTKDLEEKFSKIVNIINKFNKNKLQTIKIDYFNNNLLNFYKEFVNSTYYYIKYNDNTLNSDKKNNTNKNNNTNNNIIEVPLENDFYKTMNNKINHISNEKIRNMLIKKNIIESKDTEIFKEILSYALENKYEEIIICEDNLLLSDDIDYFFNTKKLKEIQRKNDIIYIIKKNTLFDNEETIYGFYLKKNKITEYSNFLRLFYS